MAIEPDAGPAAAVDARRRRPPPTATATRHPRRDGDLPIAIVEHRRRDPRHRPARRGGAAAAPSARPKPKATARVAPRSAAAAAAPRRSGAGRVHRRGRRHGQRRSPSASGSRRRRCSPQRARLVEPDLPGQGSRCRCARPRPTRRPRRRPSHPRSRGTSSSTGDTVSGIAAALRPRRASVLSANGLGWSSIIFPGQTIAIPAAAARPGRPSSPPPAPPSAAGARRRRRHRSSATYVVVAGDTLIAIAAPIGVERQPILDAQRPRRVQHHLPGPDARRSRRRRAPSSRSAVSMPLTDEMPRERRARSSRSAASLGVPDQGIVIALAAAAQESSLRNLALRRPRLARPVPAAPEHRAGARRSRSSTPCARPRAFFGGAANPNAGARAGCSTSRAGSR